MILSHYAMSHDGTKLAVVPEVGGDQVGVWLADASGVEPPQQIFPTGPSGRIWRPR